MDKESQKKYVSDRIRFIMDLMETPWFYCFGKLQAFITSRGQDFDMNYDIDIGVIQDKCDVERVQQVIGSEGYALKSVLINDVTGSPLNMHFIPTEVDMKDTPSIDVYVWVRKGKRLYHTYDTKKEGHKIPKEYVFKGVPSRFLDPDKQIIEDTRRKDPSMRADGTWEYGLFGEYSGYSFRLPYAYGSLLDVWYPGWLFPNQKNMESNTVDIIKTKSCAHI